MHRNRKVPGLNTTSTADISFMLLIFFLVTTSMNPDKGLSLRLPPPPANKEVGQLTVKERNILQVRLDASDRLTVNDQPMAVNRLKEKAKAFIANPANNPNLPEKHHANIKMLGNCMVTDKHVISVLNDRGASYNAYFAVLNELMKAYNELRNEMAVRKFGHSFAECTNDQKQAIRTFYPQKISEAEPSNKEGVQP